MEITQEKYEKLLLKAQKFDMLSKVIAVKADDYATLKVDDLLMLKAIFCQEESGADDGT